AENRGQPGLLRAAAHSPSPVDVRATGVIMRHRAMPDLSALLEHWRYPAIFAAVILGNCAPPVPEETVLALGGFLAQRGELHLPTVIAVGVLAAIVGDNIGYWLGRRYGREGVEAYGRYIWGRRD